MLHPGTFSAMISPEYEKVVAISSNTDLLEVLFLSRGKILTDPVRHQPAVWELRYLRRTHLAPFMRRAS
jgi:hypothetical protein